MPSEPLFSTILGLGMGGTGIVLGGLAACGLAEKHGRYLEFMLAGAAGMIFSLLVFELLPESLAVGGAILTVAGITTGLVLTCKLEKMLHRVVIITGQPQCSLLIRSGLLLATGIAIHNLPIGFAMGASFANQPKISFDLATTMIFHNFPEGLAIFLPMIMAGLNRIFIPVTASIVAFPAGLGSFIGSMLGISNTILAFSLGIAIGTIFYVTWHEILGRAAKLIVWNTMIPCLGAGILLGKLFTLFLK